MVSDDSPQLSSETEALLARLRSEFVEDLPGVGLDPQERLTRLFDVWRQATLRRIVDLGSGADAFFREGRLVPANTLARSVVETVAIHFMVWKKLQGSIEGSDWSAVRALLLRQRRRFVFQQAVATVDHHHLPGDVAGRGAGQKDHHGGHLQRGARALERGV